MTKLHLFIIIFAILMLTGCEKRQANRNALQQVEELINYNPRSAQRLLDSLRQHETDSNSYLHMKYRLMSLYAINKLDTCFLAIAEAQELTDYFSTHGTSNEQMLSNYLLVSYLKVLFLQMYQVKIYHQLSSLLQNLQHFSPYLE